jgi:diguanylate cyclase (GGDEF)-like protein
MNDATQDVSAEFEALIQFLYRAPVGLLQCGIDGSIEMLNPMSAQLLMPLAASGSVENLFVVLDGIAPQLRRLTADFGPGTGSVCESLRIVHRSQRAGSTAEQTLSLSLLKLDGGRMMAMLSDITLEVEREQQAWRRKLEDASRVDGLTKVPTRAVAREQVMKALARQAGDPGLTFAVLHINCDGIRQINDALGRAAGDAVLALMAERLRATARRRRRQADAEVAGDFVARLGGDEFLVVFDELYPADGADHIGRRLLEAMAQPYPVGGQQLRCTVSIGIVTGRRSGGDADTVLRDAGIAMVEAKRAGGDRFVFFEPGMQQRAADRRGMESDLRQALAQGQLFVVYQPVVGLQGMGDAIDRCAGVEALVRWQHPLRGVVPPIKFIGLAEECGLISELGDFVLLTACRQFVEWRRTLGTRAPRLLAVNVSRGQLGIPDFVESVGRILASTQMEPARLQLEITESLAAQDEAVQSTLRSLKALGLTLALDDFGTGYSSLASLHLLPVDTVKVDRSFVSEAVTSEHHRVLIAATVRVAKSLRMGTVAEGIETAEQARVVRALECEKGQGYFFSRPLSAADLVLWMDPGGPSVTPCVGDSPFADAAAVR